MELNDDIPEIGKNKNEKDEIDLLINNPINDLIELKNILESSLSDEAQQPIILGNTKQKIYHSLYENYSFRGNSQIIKEIVNIIENYIISHSDGIQTTIIELLESLMMMFLFHFDIYINKIGFELLKFLIDILEQSYPNEILEYFIKIIQLLDLKKQVNKTISSIIIYNISLGIYIIMSDNQILKENKNCLFDFIKRNINNFNLIYLLFIPSIGINSLKYFKLFSNDEIKFIYEKISEKLNEAYTFFVENLSKKKNNILFIQENINKIGIFCKILDCVTVEGSRTYIIDKLIKNMKPLCENILNDCLVELLNNDELKLSAESIENIFLYFKTIGVFSLENFKNIISFVNRKFNDYSNGYLSIILIIIQELERLSSSFDENKTKNFGKLIIQIIEIVCKKNREKNDNNFHFDIYELYKINQIYKFLLKIDSKIEITRNYPNAYKLLVEDKNNNINYFEYIEDSFNDKNFSFLSQTYLDSIAAGNKENNIINKNCFINCLNKFEEFKNSIKETLCIRNAFSVDKNIEKEKKEINNKENITYDDFKNFFLNNSMEIFNEIYSKE